MRIKKLVGVFTALAIALMTAVIAIPSAAASSADAQFANRLHVLINDYRAQHALAPLRWNDQMSAESQSWTQQSADQANIYGAGVFQHSPGSYAFPENIVWNMSADQAFSWWVNSPPHRANMLRAADTDIGIGAVQLTAGPNRGAYLATAKFGQFAVSVEDEAAAREADAREAEKKAAAEAEARAAAERAAADEAAAKEAAAKDAAAKAAAKEAADQAAAEAAAKAAAEEAAAKAAKEPAAAAPDTKQADQDKAAADKAAADKAAAEAAARKAAEEAAAQEAVEKAAAAKAAEEAAAKEAADRKAAEDAAAEKVAAAKAAEEAAAQQAAEDAAARSVDPAHQAAEEQAAAEAAIAREQAEADAAAQAAAVEAAANEAAAKETAQAAAAAKAAAEEETRRAAEQAKAKAAAGVATVEQVTLGQEALLTDAARGTVTAVASGSQLRISGLASGAAYEVVLPSAGVNLGAVNADAKGSLAAAVPAVLAAGEHKVALFRDGVLAGWTTFTVEQAVTVMAAQPVPAAADGTTELAATGLNAAQLAIGGIGALMALTGGAALVALQRQRAASLR
ncbi:CAP domain-containing protein [Arthrobacter gengyunqii]|uniref:CAP domain-containing protein n=1 Tax=Arthrobacter gengyunqii TaxID=2886940 RepID=A0ABS8GHC2_9MICC|nr:CAP domain-containing protein [Arthrobacter gengyunqii]MCC3265553.1 CAP domain-containing protein [Arthrobacter gengyunqii]